MEIPDYACWIVAGIALCIAGLLARVVIVMYADSRRRERDIVAALRMLSGSLGELPRE